jgi:hypothetical protein
MPDGDIVHSQLSGLYQKAYEWLCEGKANSSECAQLIKRAVIQDIKKNYGIGVKYAKQMGEMLGQAMENAGQNSSVNWAALSTEIDRQVRQAEVKHDVKELLRRAGKGILHEFRYNPTAETRNLPEAVVERLFQEVYKSKFEQRIPLTPNHHADVDNATVAERVEAIRPDIFSRYQSMGEEELMRMRM